MDEGLPPRQKHEQRRPRCRRLPKRKCRLRASRLLKLSRLLLQLNRNARLHHHLRHHSSSTLTAIQMTTSSGDSSKRAFAPGSHIQVVIGSLLDRHTEQSRGANMAHALSSWISLDAGSFLSFGLCSARHFEHPGTTKKA